jgi:hypothetical protein
MHQAAVQTKLLSPEMTIVVEAEAFHDDRRQNTCCRNGETVSAYRGLRVWHDARWSLYELGRTIGFFTELIGRVCWNEFKGRGLAEDSMVVGLADSTQSMGKPCTRGSGQQWCTGFSTCFSDTRRSG